MDNQGIINDIETEIRGAIAEIKDAKEEIYNSHLDNEDDIIGILDRAIDFCKDAASLADKYEEPDEPEEIELHEITHTTIEWHRDRANISFTDREIMDTLEKLFFNGKSAQEILQHLEQLC